MINTYDYKGTRWIDLVNPTREEVEKVANKFSLHPYVAEELKVPSVKSRAELFDHYIFLILHFPVFRLSHSGDKIEQEIDFVIGNDFIITARYDTVEPLEKFARVVEVKAILDRGSKEHKAGYIFFGILQEIYQSLFNELEFVGNRLSRIEDEIFKGKEREMVMALSEVSRNLLNFKKSISFHDEVLSSLELQSRKLFEDRFHLLVRRALDEHFKVQDLLRSNIESLNELRETNNALLSTRQNEVIQVLTVMAFIGIPLTLLATLLQIDSTSRPIIGMPNDFWILVLIMAGIGLCMFVFFKFKKWL